jgi:hypothetical protein
MKINKRILLIFFSVSFLIISFYVVFADIIVVDFDDSNYYNSMIELNNVADLPDGGNSINSFITEFNSENSINTILVDDTYQFEESRQIDNIVEINPYNYNPTFDDYPLDMKDNADNLPFGGLNNDPALSESVLTNIE